MNSLEAVRVLNVFDETLEALRCVQCKAKDMGMRGSQFGVNNGRATPANPHSMISYVTQDVLDTAEQLRDMLGEVRRVASTLPLHLSRELRPAADLCHTLPAQCFSHPEWLSSPTIFRTLTSLGCHLRFLPPPPRPPAPAPWPPPSSRALGPCEHADPAPAAAAVR